MKTAHEQADNVLSQATTDAKQNHVKQLPKAMMNWEGNILAKISAKIGCS